MRAVAVTVVGSDRPGIVAQVAGAVADVGGNLEDSSMTLLRGHFAMTLIATVPGEAMLRERLEQLRSEDLSVSVLALPEVVPTATNKLQILSLYGSDKPGIVARVTQLLAQQQGNIIGISTRLGNDLYVMTAEVEFLAAVDLGMVRAELAELSEELGVKATLHPADADVL